MVMGQSSDGIHLLYEFMEDFIYWKTPEKSVILLKEIIKLPLPIMLVIYILPLRYFFVLGIWALALSHSPFFTSMFSIASQKISETYNYINKKHFSVWLSEFKSSFFRINISLPYSDAICGMLQYCRKKKRELDRHRPLYEKQSPIQEDGVEQEENLIIDDIAKLTQSEE